MASRSIIVVVALVAQWYGGACGQPAESFNHGELSAGGYPAGDYAGHTGYAPFAPPVPGPESPLPPFTRAAALEILPNYLRNTDFETTAPDGSPSEWNIFRQAFFDVDPNLARSGRISLRSSYLFGWAQDLLIPVSPYQSFAVAGYALREADWERAGVRGAYFDEAGVFIKEENPFSPIAAPPGEYGEFWTVQEVPERAHQLQLFLRGRAAQSWIRFDDLSTFSEQLRFPADPTEEAWQLTGGASVDGHTLSLPGGSSAAQRVVVGPENQSYFMWGRYAADADTELTVLEQWLPRDSTETTATTSTTHLLRAPTGTFLSDPGRMPGTATGQAQVILQAAEPGGVTLRSLRRGFAKVEPTVLTAGPTSPDGSLKLTAAWPEHLTTATVQIIPASGIPSDATTVTQMGTSVRAEWDPATASSGDYVARFMPRADDGEFVTVDRPFRVVREDTATTTIAPYNQPEFTRGIWLFITGNYSASDTFKSFELLREDGFNFAVVLATLNNLPAIRQAAELYDIPYVIFAPEAVNVFRDYEKRSWFSKADYIARLKSMFAPLEGSALFQGVYVVDEPTRREELETLRKTFLSLAQDGTLGVPFTVFLETITARDFEQVQPPVGLVDVYPYNFDVGRGSTDELLLRIPIENSHARSLASLGRNLWILPQGFISRLNGNGVYPVPPSMHSAQLGAAVLAGARGILPFFYAADGTMEGLRWPGLNPTPKLAPYQRFNAVVERIGPLLMQLEVPDLHPDTPPPFAVSTAAGPEGESYIFALNADEETTRTLLVDLQSTPTGPLADVVAERKLSVDGNGNVQVELPPGEWALFSVGSNAIEALSVVPAPAPISLTTIDLPVTHQFTVTGLSDSGQPVRELEFDAAGDALAATVPFVYAPSEPMIYNLQSSGTAVRENGAISFLSEKNGVTEDGLYAVASPLVGFELYAPGGFNSPPVAEFKGRTGGGYDVLRDGETTWASLDIGIRQLQNTEAGLVSTAVGWANRGNYYGLFGPFDDGSVSVVISNYGVSNIKPGQLHEFLHRYEILNGVDRNADMNADNLLAVPRHQRGVALFQLGPTGEPQIAGNIAADAQDACAVAWIYDNLLAVVDGYKNVKFYHVLNNEATLLETWRPPTPDYFYMLSLSVTEGKLAVGFQDGRVVVADTAQLQKPSAAMADWQLYE